MIAAFILAAIATAHQAEHQDFYFRRDSAVSGCAFAAVVPLPKLNPREINQLQIALDLVPQGSSEYSTRAIRQILQGSSIKCKLLSDAVSISFSVPEGAEKSGESLLLSLIKDPAFDEIAIQPAIQELSNRTSGYWEREVDPRPMALQTATHQELEDIFHRVFNLSSVRLGAIASRNLPDLEKTWNLASKDWPAAPEPPILEEPPPLPLPKTQPDVSTAEFIGADIPASSPAFAADILALYALGTGKVSALFRLSRQEHAWSYDQQSLLWPSSADLWSPRLFVAMGPSSDNPKRLQQLSDELTADVPTWTSETRDAALGMAEANLVRQVPFGPITWNGAALSGDPEQRIAFDLYWNQKNGAHFSSRDLLESLKSVDLIQMKSAAVNILKGAKLHYLSAE